MRIAVVNGRERMQIEISSNVTMRVATLARLRLGAAKRGRL